VFGIVRYLVPAAIVASIAAPPSLPAQRPVARGHVWAILEERDLVPEGTAWDPATGSVLVGSLNKSKVVAIGPDGSVTDRVPRGTAGLASVAGIHVDSVRGTLWVTSNARYDEPSDTTPSTLYAFDAATGRLRARYASPLRRGFLNDITTSPDGTVFITDTRHDQLWTLRPGREVLEPFSPAGRVTGGNGITISSDGRVLFLAQRDQVTVIPLDGGMPWRLAVPDSVTIPSIDGLAYADGALIAHHPLRFSRIARYRLDPEMRSVIGRELFESSAPDIRTSTTGEIAGEHYVYIGNGQIDRMNEGTLDSATMQPVRMYRIPLRAGPTGLVAVSLAERDSVALFDAQTLERRLTLPVGNNPHEIAVSPDGRRAYIANAGDTSISIVETGATPRIAATWFLPDTIRVHDVAVSPDGRTVWAVSGERRLVLEIESASGRVVRRLPVERAGGWMIEAGGPDGALVVGNLEGGAVTLLDPASGRQNVFAAAEGEIDAAPTPDRSEIWSVNLRSGLVTAFDSWSGTVLEKMPGGNNAGRVVFSRDGRTALVVSGDDSTVIAIDVRSRKRIGSVLVPGGPKILAMSRDGRRAYVSHPERRRLTLIDVPAMTVLHSVEVPGTPDGVGVLEPPPPGRPLESGQVDRLLQAVDSGFNGTVLIARNGKVVFNQSYGWADQTRTAPVTATTPFWIASISKQFAAAAILKLEEDGKLSLEDRISRFFPRAPQDKQSITVHQLLTHTAGLQQQYAADGVVERDRAVAAILAQPLARPPGGEFGYSNDAYNLIAAIVEIVSGKPYEAYLRENLLEPAGLVHTGFWGPPAHPEVAAILAAGSANPAFNLPNWGFRGAVGMYSTAADLYRWYQALQENRVLTARAGQRMLSTLVTRGTLGVGYGWFTSPGPDGIMSNWTRGYEGFGHGAVLASYPDAKVVIVVVTNSGEKRPQVPVSHELAQDLAALILP
jgi:CubicO group peptidase (beta-lactamase class C family)/DNA-binding beta-propeller fold protein YncE